MKHDPERIAAAYLAGELTGRRKDGFEAHLLTCDDCWAEVRDGRRGRLLAESLRQVAPAQLRERVRAIAATEPASSPSRRRRPMPPRLLVLGATAAAIATLLVISGLLLVPHQHDQPRPIAAAVAAYETAGPDRSPSGIEPPITAIGSFTWQATSRRDLGGIHATLFRYADPAGRTLLIIRSPDPIPTADGARRLSSHTTSWTATVHHASLFCADQPGVSWLALAPDPTLVRAAGNALGLS